MIEVAKRVLSKIENKGYKAYIVGGFVRDYILKKECCDVDICTNATPKEITDIFDNVKIAKEEYGSVTLYYQNIRFEITTFRKEKDYVDYRRPENVIYIDNLEDDLKRRDFTVNTICMDKNGKIIDHLNGIEDLYNSRLDSVGYADFKFKQDALRILRAIRFATVLNFQLSDEVEKAIYNNRNLLVKLSNYRKKEELDKIFTSNNLLYGISLLKKFELDEILNLNNLDYLKKPTDLIGMWSVIDADDYYNFPNYEKKIMSRIRYIIDNNINVYDNIVLYEEDLYVLSLVIDIMNKDKSTLNDMYRELPIKSRKDIDIKAYEICEILNKKTGAFLSTVYCDLEKRILQNKLDNSKERIAEYIINNYKDVL